MIRLIEIFYLLLVACMPVCGQHGLSAVYAPSKVIKHRENLKFDVPSLSHEIRLAYTYQTRDDSSWARFWNRPRITVNALYVNFGDENVLGSAYAFLPELHFILARRDNLSLNMQFGTGVAYLTHPFDAIDNPNNNAIGSHLNNTSSLKFGVEYKWTDRVSTSLSTGIVHFSNGLSSSPNSGINIYGASLLVHYKLLDAPVISTPADEVLTRSPEVNEHKQKWIIDGQYHYGFTEHATPDGPKYGVHAVSLGIGYKYKEWMSMLAGAEYEYNDEVYTFHKRNFFKEEDARFLAKRSILYLENEFRYGPVFNRFRLGFYLGWPYSKNKTNYIKVVTGLYIPGIQGTAKPYVGVVLKTHTAIADYLAVMAGVSF